MLDKVAIGMVAIKVLNVLLVPLDCLKAPGTTLVVENPWKIECNMQQSYKIWSYLNVIWR